MTEETHAARNALPAHPTEHLILGTREGGPRPSGPQGLGPLVRAPDDQMTHLSGPAERAERFNKSFWGPVPPGPLLLYSQEVSPSAVAKGASLQSYPMYFPA